MSKGFLIGAAIYAAGQLFNFLFQLLLLQKFGLDHYGEVGLAHIAMLTVIFVGDLGYSSLFLREDPTQSQWTLRWRTALTHRLLFTLALDLLAVIGWLIVYGPHGDGFAYLLAVVPATLFSLAGYSAPLLAQGRRASGFLMQQVAWPCAALLWLGIHTNIGQHAGTVAGLVVSVGFFLQACVNVAVFKRIDLLWPAWNSAGNGQLRSALHLSAMGIAGTLHERLTPFLIAHLAPGFLPVFLMLGHGMNGAAGIFAQFNRLLLAETENPHGLRWALGLGSLLLGATALAFQVLLLVCAQWGGAREQAWLILAFPVLLGWTLATVSGFVAALLIGRRKERELTRIIVLGLGCSAVLQYLAFSMDSPQGVMWARLLCLLGIALASLHLCRLAPRWPGVLIFASCLCAAPAVRSPWLLAAGLLLLLLAMGVSANRPLLFRETNAFARGAT